MENSPIIGVRVLEFGVNISNIEDDPVFTDAGDIQVLIEHKGKQSFVVVEADIAEKLAATLTEAAALSRRVRAEHEAEIG